MNASEQIYTLLSPRVDGRVYPLFIPETQQIALPYIVYQPISTLPENTLDGTTGHEWVSMQIDVYCDDYDELLALSRQVINELATIKPSSYDGRQILYDDALYRAIIEFGFWQTTDY